MSLTLVATPIGNKDDITLRALKALEASEYLIAEEAKVLRRRLSSWNIPPQNKKIYTLNEHSTPKEVDRLGFLAQDHSMCLVSDCGTPSFFDPGFQLVEICYKKDIEVKALPGVSSLTSLMPYLPKKTERFSVEGFPPREDKARKNYFNKLSQKKEPFFLMDTPYRLKKTVTDLKESVPEAYCALAVNLTCENEMILFGTPKVILEQLQELKKENFVCMVYPKNS